MNEGERMGENGREWEDGKEGKDGKDGEMMEGDVMVKCGRCYM